MCLWTETGPKPKIHLVCGSPGGGRGPRSRCDGLKVWRTPICSFLQFSATSSVLIAKSGFSGRGWGQQLFSFQSPAVQWMARTSSLNSLSCRNPYQTPHSLNCLPPFSLKTPFLSLKSASSHPLPKNRLWLRWWTPICNFLQFSATSSVFCEYLRPPKPWKATKEYQN